jgi:ATP-dependent exoDNAse (exonuclease V) beta subunit
MDVYVEQRVMPTNDGAELKRIDVVGASAGTGKTFRLATEFLDRTSGSADGADIIATTFTNKAADELLERIRRELMRSGDWKNAQAVLAGYVGTVNSVCGRIVTDLAVDAGLSPSVDVIAEERQTEVFYAATEEIMRTYQTDLWETISRLSKEEEWRKDISSVVSLARQNNIEAESLESFATDSWQRLKALMGVPASDDDGDHFDRVLRKELNNAIQQLDDSGDNSRTTAETLAYLKEVSRGLRRTEEIPWQVWAKLSKTKTVTASKRLVTKLIEASNKHSMHPRLHSDVEKLIFGMFHCAKDCMARYQNFKAERGLIDFIDQEQIALRTLQQAPIRELLAERFGALLVDEFQDTSPIQLAVFLQLANLMESVWVGDEKQSIFRFRGADPELMQDCLRTLVPLTKGQKHRLETSYRSRPSLVDFVNEVFTTAMPQVGISSESVEITKVHRGEDPKLAHPLHFWWLEPQSIDSSLDALANGVRQILNHQEDWQVVDKATTKVRPMRGSDIAILCRSNERRLAVAQALSQAGLIVATEREKLLDTPECVLALAALRVLVDAYDTLAMAEIVRLTLREADQTNWLTIWLKASRDELNEAFPCLAELICTREKLVDSTPTQALELAITTPCILSAIKSWGKFRQRMLNLDALRGLAKSYENLCLTRRSAATPAGLVAFCLADSTRNQRSAHQPPNPDDQAIQVLTYHKSKGLEWPMVILTELDAPLPATPFGIFTEGLEQPFDAAAPLAGRSIRYWPWPYGRQRVGMPLAATAARSKEMNLAQRKHAGENVRLLYVGMTRARDYLTFACQPKTGGTGWLSAVVDEHGQPIFSLPFDQGPKSILNTRDDLLAEMSIIAPNPELHSQADALPLYEDTEQVPAVEKVPYSVSQSTITQNSGLKVQVKRKHVLGQRINLAGQPDIELVGDAVHRFIAADDSTALLTDRMLMAERVLRNWGIDDCMLPADLVEICDRLRRQIDLIHPGATWHRECPITGRMGVQRMRGSIDLLLELPDSYVIVDHKTFPGRYELWDTKAISLFPQLAAYKHLVEQASEKPVGAVYIHMPIVGTLMELTCADA